MRIKTTTIGAFPKPSCTPIGDWFPDADDENAKGADRGLLQRWSITDYEDKLEEAGENAETEFLNAIHEVIDDQVQAGIDIPTDGEVRRENYIYYHQISYFQLGQQFYHLQPKNKHSESYQ